jgi:hypothetical protein
MKEGIVGYVVGFSVGKFVPPDKGQANGISGLTTNCRECRVSTAGETAGEINSTFAHRTVQPTNGSWPKNRLNAPIRPDLNDAGNRR